MYLDQQPVCSGGDRRVGKGCHQIPPAGRVARIGDYGKVGLLLEHRDGRQVEGVSSRVRESSYTPFAEDHVLVPLLHDVLRGQEQVLHRGRHSPLEKDRPLESSDLGEEGKILHVTRSDLEHVGVFGDQVGLAWIHDFSHDREAGLGTDVREHLEPIFAQPAEGVR